MVILGAAETHPGDYRISMKADEMLQLDSAYWKQQMALMPEPARLQEMFDKVAGAVGTTEISKNFFAAIKCPVRAMAGYHDQFLTTQRVVNAAKMIPKGELAIIPACTHTAFLDRFPAVWFAANAFLEKKSDTIQNTAMDNSVEQVLSHHLTAFGNNDLDEIVKDYTEGSIILIPGRTVKGLKDIRKFFEDYFSVVPTGSSFSMKYKAVVANVAYLAWESESASTKIPMGTDTFIFEGDKIKYHTVADHRIKKKE